MRVVPAGFVYALALWLGFALNGPAGLAQTASQITPPSTRPAMPAVREIALPEAGGVQPPANVANLYVRLADVAIEGEVEGTADNPQIRSARAACRTALAGQTVTVGAIFAAAHRLEVAYFAAGYGLVRVVVPAQKLVNGGRLRLLIVDGFLERVDVAGVPSSVRPRIEALLVPLTGRKGLRMADVERRLLLAGDTPGTRLRSTLTAGKQPGASVLIVEAGYSPVTGSLSVDNTVGRSIGGYETTLALQANTPLGFGEQLYVSIGGMPKIGAPGDYLGSRPLNRQLSAGLLVPLGLDGLTFNVEATRTDAAPQANTAIDFFSRFERYSARLRYPWLRNRMLTFASEVAFDAQEEELYSIGSPDVPLSLDRLRVLRSSHDLSIDLPTRTTLSAHLTASLGIDALGARDASSATPALPLSRQGADAHFFKVDASAHAGQVLADHLLLDVYARGQTSFGQALPTSEQFSLVGSNQVSGFDAGQFEGDTGAAGRAEMSTPWPVDLGPVAAVLSPYGFADAGIAWLSRPTAAEQREIRAESVGLGVRLSALPAAAEASAPPLGWIRGSSLSLEMAFTNRSDTHSLGNRLTVVGTIQF